MHNRGFTLIEIALMLVIAALIMGAIFVGQTLIHAAHLNSVLADVSRYSTAFTNFRDKYQAAPGDLSNAQSYWGTPTGGCPNGTGSGKEVCNGNGDGQVCVANTAADTTELHSEWIELANAGLINGSYHYTSAATGGFQIGLNTPTTAIGNGTFQFAYATCPINDGLYNTVTPYNIHWLIFGGLIANTGAMLPILNGVDGYSIDIKTDDGRPGIGKIRASRNATTGGNTPNCQTTSSADTALYSQTTADPTCTLMFQLSQ